MREFWVDIYLGVVRPDHCGWEKDTTNVKRFREVDKFAAPLHIHDTCQEKFVLLEEMLKVAEDGLRVGIVENKMAVHGEIHYKFSLQKMQKALAELTELREKLK